MKKIFAILLAVMLMASLTVTAFADNVPSPQQGGNVPVVPGANAAEENVDEEVVDLALESVIDANDADITADVALRLLSEAGSLNAEDKASFDEGYNKLMDAENLADVNEDLKGAAGDQDIYVSEVFFLEGDEETAFPATVTLKYANVDNFLALLHYVDGEWVWVDTEVKDGSLVFETESFGTFAIISLGTPAASADTGESAPVAFIVGAVVLAGAAAFFFMKSRKVEA